MHTKKAPNLPIFSMPLDAVAQATGIGRTNVFAAAASGELETFKPVINGKSIKRRLATPEAVQKWVDSIRSKSNAGAA